MMLAMLQALLLIALGVGVAATINLLFDWRRNRRIDRWMKEPRYLPACASAGAIRPARPGRRS